MKMLEVLKSFYTAYFIFLELATETMERIPKYGKGICTERAARECIIG